MLDALITECDRDRDSRISFLEFSNFLCFKDSMKTGLNVDRGKMLFISVICEELKTIHAFRFGAIDFKIK